MVSLQSKLMNVTIGKRFQNVMNAIHSYRAKMIEYLTSQKEAGYLELKDSPALLEDKDSVLFKMGQYQFLFQMTVVSNQNKIIAKTYRMPRYPETKFVHIEDMDIIIESVSDMRLGIAKFITEKLIIDDWDNRRNEPAVYLQDFFPEYFFFIDNHIKTLNEPGRTSVNSR